ncbi:MAG: DUF262 domain-containing protein [Candidatus Pacebacteria bacterium]|nr:DUF262 domain-containing protein [Candidatus Paceibacterota bacterium]
MAELVSQPTSVQSVYSWYREDKLYVNRRYQRKLVWTLEEKQKLIESILRKYPIPAILVAEKEDKPGTYEIIDGLQRLHAILSFIETAFPTLDNRHFALEYFPTAKGRADEGAFVPTAGVAYLMPREVSTILDYSLALSVMRNSTEAEVNDVFDRINTYGHRLSDQERRQAGVQDVFSTMVREISCALRGDVSLTVLLLYQMPSISVDLPMSRHGYQVHADEVFWVNQGILRSTDLRDSMDEQCIADIAACIVGGQLIERSKDALDEIYSAGSAESERILAALDVYGSHKFCDELKFCVDELLKVCADGHKDKLRDIVFTKRTTNPFPSVFANVIIAFHEITIKEGRVISDYAAVKKGLSGLSERIGTGQKATAVEERRKNINTIKGLVGTGFVSISRDKLQPKVYANHTAIDIESIIRRSEIELGGYELKQGLCKLEKGGKLDPGIIEKIVKTICAIANNGPVSYGKLLVGVTDKDADAERAREVDKVDPMKVGKRFVVGVNREAKRLGLSVDKYITILKDGVRKSKLSSHVRDAVLSNMKFNAFYGLGVIVVEIPAQKELSYVGDEVYWRNGDSTELATTPKRIAELAKRF